MSFTVVLSPARLRARALSDKAPARAGHEARNGAAAQPRAHGQGQPENRPPRRAQQQSRARRAAVGPVTAGVSESGGPRGPRRTTTRSVRCPVTMLRPVASQPFRSGARSRDALDRAAAATAASSTTAPCPALDALHLLGRAHPPGGGPRRDVGRAVGGMRHPQPATPPTGREDAEKLSSRRRR
jgi:hypothetical protein